MMPIKSAVGYYAEALKRPVISCGDTLRDASGTYMMWTATSVELNAESRTVIVQ